MFEKENIQNIFYFSQRSDVTVQIKYKITDILNRKIKYDFNFI